MCFFFSIFLKTSSRSQHPSVEQHYWLKSLLFFICNMIVHHSLVYKVDWCYIAVTFLMKFPDSLYLFSSSSVSFICEVFVVVLVGGHRLHGDSHHKTVWVIGKHRSVTCNTLAGSAIILYSCFFFLFKNSLCNDDVEHFPLLSHYPYPLLLPILPPLCIYACS